MPTTLLEDKNSNKSINRSISNNFKCMRLKQIQIEIFQRTKILKLNNNNKELISNSSREANISNK